MKTFYVTNRGSREVNRHGMMEGQSDAISFDWSSWAEDNGALSGVTWSLESGQANITSESLSSNVASAQITTSQSGWSLIKLTATNGTDTDIQFLEILAKDPERPSTDYGMCL